MIICESERHRKIELRHHQKCPECGSTAYHTTLMEEVDAIQAHDEEPEEQIEKPDEERESWLK